MSQFGFTLILFAISALSAPALWADTLVLDENLAIELALKNNYQLQQNQERVLEAAAGKAVALGSFFPQISASGSYTRLGTLNEFQLVTPVYRQLPLRVYDPQTGQLIGFTDSVPMPVGADTLTMPLGSQDNYILRTSVQQTVFTWGKLINAYRIAGLTLAAQKAAYEVARQQTKVQTIEAFYQTLLTEKTKELIKESYEQLKRHVQQVERLYESGLASRLDVMRAKLSLTSMANQVIQVENGITLAYAALYNLIGVSEKTVLVLRSEFNVESLDIDLSSVFDSALSNRPELNQLRQTLRIANLGVQIARTANLPTIFTQFNYDYKKPVGFNDRWGKDWNATIGVSMPIFTGLANYHKLKQAQSRYRQAALAVKMVEEGIKLEVQAALANLHQEQQNIAFQKENVAVAQEAFQLAEQRYNNGLLSNLEFLDIQLQLTQSRVAHLRALAGYTIARARLLRAIGKI